MREGTRNTKAKQMRKEREREGERRGEEDGEENPSRVRACVLIISIIASTAMSMPLIPLNF